VSVNLRRQIQTCDYLRRYMEGIGSTLESFVEAVGRPRPACGCPMRI
jgi:hypothetical protein